MNKEELIKKLETTQSFYKMGYRVDRYTDGYIQGLEAALMLIDQLDEPEKPVVPQFVAEWIEEYKKENVSAFLAYNRARIFNHPSKVWIMSNPDLFVRAWLDGYTVEEKKYYVKFTDYEHSYLNRLDDGKLIVSDFTKKLCLFTEQEIKDYDERYWAFKKPAEELEE